MASRSSRLAALHGRHPRTERLIDCHCSQHKPERPLSHCPPPGRLHPRHFVPAHRQDAVARSRWRLAEDYHPVWTRPQTSHRRIFWEMNARVAERHEEQNSADVRRHEAPTALLELLRQSSHTWAPIAGYWPTSRPCSLLFPRRHWVPSVERPAPPIPHQSSHVVPCQTIPKKRTLGPVTHHEMRRDSGRLRRSVPSSNSFRSRELPASASIFVR